ncbi:hypothetical protein [Microbacterium sp.]|uniref:hypothetical protein n=1 Tax=Microbacterium sp. TaxID=51671 RepID=UPI0025E5D7CF|nr:hypothetical protein [Microbacterium sp.]MBT9605466.1 hypothetical protein [Microbacterium sp.]
MKRNFLIIPATILILAMSGCAQDSGGPKVNSDLTVDEAKRSTQAMAQTLAQLVPVELVSAVDQDPDGVLIKCGGDREYQWTGMTRVTLSPEVPYDGNEVTQDIAAQYRDASPYHARLGETSDGEPRVQVFQETGEDHLLSRSVDKSTIEIVSFSPCFTLAEGMSPSEKY